MAKENFKLLNPSYIDAKMAIAIADSNVGLKLSIYREALKKNICYGLLEFSEFKVSLVFYKSELCWLIKVTKGEWGSTNFIKIPLINKTITLMNSDGDFDENSNIWCLVTVEEGNYIYGDKINKKDIVYATKKDLNLFFKEKAKINKMYNKKTADFC